jgi:FkbM family methyltransferase
MEKAGTQQLSKQFPATNGLRSLLAWKLRAARRVLQREGLWVLVWEMFCQGLKPLLRVYESLAWHWNCTSGSLRFEVHGNVLTVLPGDQGISRELSAYRTHEPLATKLLKQFLKPGMNVVDIGGNLGYYALLEARAVGNAGRVVAIEPVAANFAQLSKNVKANGYRNIRLHNVAIGASNGIAAMYIGKKSNWHSLHPVPWKTRKTTVRVSTLDAMLGEHNLRSVDLIRMDLEGYEVEVIHGMAETLENYSPRLLVELHPHVAGADAILRYLRQLKTLGYNLDWVLDHERDRPLRSWFLRPEKLTLEELLTDPRITTYKRTLHVLLARNGAKRIPLERDSSWTPAQTLLGGCGSVPRG